MTKMKKTNKQIISCSCLIPAYNEAKRISQVLSVLSSSQRLDQLVVVDDGSSDETSAVVEHNFPHVKLITLKKNNGKIATVKEGLKEINSDKTFLCDADLSQLKIEEVHAALDQFAKKSDLEMIILKRVNEIKELLEETKNMLKVDLPDLGLEFKPKTLERLSCLLSGERIIKTSTLKKILQESNAEGYALEVVINQYIFEHQLDSCWMPSQAVGSLKIEQLGILPFINKYISMHLNLVQQLGTKQYLQQLQSFCTERCDN